MVRGVRGGSNGVNVDHGHGAETPRTMKAPFLTCQMSKWFLRHFPQHRSWSNPLRILGLELSGNTVDTRIYVVQATGV
jgi:hypothetical protein